MAVNLSPVLNDAQFTNTGALAVGYKIYTYAEGSSTPLATYTTSAGTVPQANPIILNARGEVNNLIWLTGGLGYKLVLTTDTDVVVRTEDNIRGVNDSSTTTDQWVVSGVTPTYVSTTQFTLPGDQTSIFQVGRRIKATVTAGTVYGTISVSAYAALTTVTLIMDAGQVLDSGLSAVSYGILSNTNDSIPAIVKAPFIDSTALVKGSADATKLVRVEADTITTATTRVWTAQDKDITVAGLADVTGLFPISAVLTTNTLVTTLSASVGLPFSLGFRSATLATGTPNTYTFTSNSTITAATTASLGLVTTVQGRIAVLEAYNGGSPVMCYANIAGGLQLDGSNLISPTTIGAGSTSAAVIYSASAVSANSPYRLVGFIDVVWTSGTGFTSLVEVQPAGGEAMIPVTFNTQGAAPMFAVRAWGVMNGTGTPAWITRGNFNATITDNGVGDYSVTFVTAMPDADYAISGTVNGPAGDGYITNINTKTASGFRFNTRTSAALGDSTYVSLMIVR